ncbi:C4-dicarboxylate-binding periplasmic protein precursor [Variibacter gotjawalensis]|uniref:C4-dicarboxylate-binding periplasmic protein n=1 Tax=Variibacter gotjawalensis TaxID=1333996 RepID=A0A0S3PQB1_9BRAD|nr:DctP family TRAP transporter solute-binding subunit [Variibacter gotjawalensis]NIK48405.1 tripartite ATP-independent transporter DctP family solute receptor [Variibacter gotjawalensis]RZS50272.1 tripartite ATP-independent transporter DctP family solute receptor [Variibacter gotjawalensis]BAT58105.1 C4-dicarboxylate-binding periplasmic protein precursor [Variibacter gotjawalensis]
MKTALKVTLGLVAALALIAPASAQTYKPEYKISTVVGAPFPWGLMAERWATIVKDKSGGKINMKVYPGASLVGGDQTKEFTAMRQGVIDMAVGSTINWSPQVAELNLFSLPFLMPDHKAIDAITQGPAGKKIFEIIGSKDVVPLAWGENGFREISNSKRDVKKPEDLKGLKIRVVGSPLYNETFTALGANPTQMSWADAQPALSTGAVDGQENPLTIFTVAKLHTVGQKHVTLWGYVADPLIFAVSKPVWDTFSPADQQILREAAVDAAKYGVEIARKGITAADPSVLKEIEGLGVTITRLTPEEQKAFQAATKPVYDKWKARIGADLVTQAEKSVAAR